MKLLNLYNKTIVISCTNYLKSTCTLDGQWSTVTLCQVSGSGTGIRCTRVVTMVLVWGEWLVCLNQSAHSKGDRWPIEDKDISIWRWFTGSWFIWFNYKHVLYCFNLISINHTQPHLSNTSFRFKYTSFCTSPCKAINDTMWHYKGMTHNCSEVTVNLSLSQIRTWLKFSWCK